jgi:hypothetical protein
MMDARDMSTQIYYWILSDRGDPLAIVYNLEESPQVALLLYSSREKAEETVAARAEALDIRAIGLYDIEGFAFMYYGPLCRFYALDFEHELVDENGIPYDGASVFLWPLTTSSLAGVVA